MGTIRVLLADDHTLVRAGIRALIEDLPGVEVVAEAGDGRAAQRMVAEHLPDVVLMDIGMPGLNGLEAMIQIVAQYPETRVVILSMHANQEYVLRALRAGAAGYLLKDAGPAELELAIQAAARNGTYLTPVVSAQVSDYVRRTEDEMLNSLDQLTPRQREVLQLIAEGCTTHSIAHILGIGAKTVETHRTELMKRLDIHDIAGLVRYAIAQGLVEVERMAGSTPLS